MLSVKTGSNHTENYKGNRGKSPKIPPCRGNTSTLRWPSFLIAFCAYVQAYMLYYKWDDSPRGNFYTHLSLLLNYFITLFPTFTFSVHISSYLLCQGSSRPPPVHWFTIRTHRTHKRKSSYSKTMQSKISEGKMPMGWNPGETRSTLPRVLSQWSRTGHT